MTVLFATTRHNYTEKNKMIFNFFEKVTEVMMFKDLKI
jgi:hypothetical protein